MSTPTETAPPTCRHDVLRWSCAACLGDRVATLQAENAELRRKYEQSDADVRMLVEVANIVSRKKDAAEAERDRLRGLLEGYEEAMRRLAETPAMLAAEERSAERRGSSTTYGLRQARGIIEIVIKHANIAIAAAHPVPQTASAPDNAPCTNRQGDDE